MRDYSSDRHSAHGSRGIVQRLAAPTSRKGLTRGRLSPVRIVDGNGVLRYAVARRWNSSASLLRRQRATGALSFAVRLNALCNGGPVAWASDHEGCRRRDSLVVRVFGQIPFPLTAGRTRPGEMES